MTDTLSLTITTPLETVLREESIVSLRAEDASGDFGIRPGHADFLTVIGAGVMRWRRKNEPWRFCALRGGIFYVAGGTAVNVTCREALLSERLAGLEEKIREARAAQVDSMRRARMHDTRLHARAIRYLMSQITEGGDMFGLDTEAEP